MTREVWALLGMCICGVACSVIYDMFRAVHYVQKKHDAAVIISDVIYWIIAAFIIIKSLWYLNTGIMRGYEFIGLAAGAVLYFCTVSRWIYKFFLTITLQCVKIIQSICKMVLTLAGFLYKITIAPVKKAAAKIKLKVTGKKRMKAKAK